MQMHGENQEDAVRTQLDMEIASHNHTLEIVRKLREENNLLLSKVEQLEDRISEVVYILTL